MKHNLPAWCTVAILLAGALLVSSSASADWTEHVRTIDSDSAGPTETFDQFDAHPLAAFDFNGDGDLEVVAHNNNRYVYVFDARDGDLLAELQTTHPEGWDAPRELNGPEATLLIEGGVPHLVVGNSAAYITLFRFEAEASGPDHLAFSKVWERRLDGCSEPNPGMDSKPVLADLTEDGRPEILGFTEQEGGFALRHDGSLLWKTCIAGGNSAPVVNDLDGSGTKQVVWAADSGEVTVSDGRVGTTQWTFDAGDPRFNLRSASIPVSVGLGQLDGEGPLDIVFGARDSHDNENYDNNHAALFAINGHGDLLWMRQHPEANPLTYTIPVVHDVDSDGINDIIWGDWNTVGHQGGIPEEDSWQTTGPANFYRYDAHGDLRWHQQLDTYWSNKDLPLADVDDDGVQEVLANGPGEGGDGIWYLNSITGEKETFTTTHPWKVTRAPIVEDLWNTGTMQWVVPVEAATNDVSGGALMVFDTHEPFDAAWPRPPDSGQHTSVGDGAFQADFDTPGGNEWWVEVYVDANKPLAGVDARDDGGDWIALEKKDWGAWAKSFHVEDGSIIEFRARATSGETEISQGYRWPEGEPAFQASFDTPGGNEWWVEVYVDANQPLTGVDARDDGGDWIALEKKDWGSWARSFHVEDGSIVEFRAHSTDGQQVISGQYRWPEGERA